MANEQHWSIRKARPLALPIAPGAEEYFVCQAAEVSKPNHRHRVDRARRQSGTGKLPSQQAAPGGKAGRPRNFPIPDVPPTAGILNVLAAVSGQHIKELN